jgi:NAD(P)H-flavin reductase
MSEASPAELELGLAASESGPRTIAPLARRRCPVTSNEDVGPYRLIGVQDDHGPPPRPGQFYMLAAEAGWGGGVDERPYLPRAFSVCRTRGKQLDFLLEDVGPGTHRLGLFDSGECALVLGPLGIGFTKPGALSEDPSARPILVAGGIGIAPLVIWSEELVGSDLTPIALSGFRSKSYARSTRLLTCESRTATDDGSTGHQGFVTELLEAELGADPSAVVYACGPPAMLEAVRRICVEREVPAQLALESGMACGFGACFGCVVRARDGYRRLCVDGPVVAAADLHERWE